MHHTDVINRSSGDENDTPYEYPSKLHRKTLQHSNNHSWCCHQRIEQKCICPSRPSFPWQPWRLSQPPPPPTKDLSLIPPPVAPLPHFLNSASEPGVLTNQMPRKPSLSLFRPATPISTVRPSMATSFKLDEASRMGLKSPARSGRTSG